MLHLWRPRHYTDTPPGHRFYTLDPTPHWFSYPSYGYPLHSWLTTYVPVLAAALLMAAHQ